MSGGYFNYQQFRLHDIAEEIAEAIKCIEDGSYAIDKAVIPKFKEAIVALRKAEVMAHRIDYLISGDDGVETFFKRWEEDLKEVDDGKI